MNLGRTEFSLYLIVTIRMAPSFMFRLRDFIFIIVMKTVSGRIMKNTPRTPFNFQAFPNITIFTGSCLRVGGQVGYCHRFLTHLCEIIITKSPIEKIVCFCKNRAAGGLLSGCNYTD